MATMANNFRIGHTARLLIPSATAFALLWLVPARAEEIQLLSAAAMQSVFNEVAGDFERNSGHRLVIRYATMGAITQRMLAGETADLVVGSTQSVSHLVKEGLIQDGSQLTVCKTGIGIVVPSTAPELLLTSIESFKRALLAAKVVIYADPAGGGAAGIHIADVIQKLDLADQLKSKTKFGAGGDVTEVTLAQGDGALGMTQISEIVGKSGAQFVGPFPNALQNYTGITLGIPAGAPRSEAVLAFIKFLQGPTAIAAIWAKGMEVD
jgi:molybdate transport system substrate-binding protein